jgi:putative restriction endonuclease
MTRDELLERVANLRVFERDLEKAPHKPLLLLWALGRFAAGAPRECHLAEVEQAIGPLLAELSPRTRGRGAEFPFWALQSDGLWVVTPSGLPPRKGHSSRPARKTLLGASVTGSLAPDVIVMLEKDPGLVDDLISGTLSAHFPAGIHARIREALQV